LRLAAPRGNYARVGVMFFVLPRTKNDTAANNREILFAFLITVIVIRGAN
jgi:heme/copper-type cytochrome/quinol oxidase subunit 4